MHTLAFYRQQRADGGVRTGIEVDDETVFHKYEPGGEDHDAALLWYVDLRCEGDHLPEDAESARTWFLANADLIKEGFRQLAEKVAAGVDMAAYPVTWGDFAAPPPGVRMNVVTSTTRRLAALDLAHILEDIRLNWEERLRSLPEMQPAAR